MQPAASPPKREDQRHEILSRGGLIADCLNRYLEADKFVRHHWRDLPHYATLRTKPQRAAARKILQVADRWTEEERRPLERTLFWSEKWSEIERINRRARSHYLTELILSLVAIFRCLTDNGLPYRRTAAVLADAGIKPERGDLWEEATLHQRVCRAGGVGKLEEIGICLMSTEPDMRPLIPKKEKVRVLAGIRKRTKTRFDERILAVEGRYYRGYPPP